MNSNQGKFRPTISAIDEVDDRNLKVDDAKQQIEGSETAPLTTNQLKLNIDQNVGVTKDPELHNDRHENDVQAETPISGRPGSFNGLKAFLIPGRMSFDALMRLSRKRRIMYVTTACLCAVLLIIIIMMIAFWPEVPFYLKAELCLEKECVQSSQQILLWSNTSKSACHDTYEWACGNFEKEFAENDYYVIKKGEWNYKTYNEYQELNELNRFISMLPTSSASYSVESMVTSLYRSCREIDRLDKSESDLLLRKAINAVVLSILMGVAFAAPQYGYQQPPNLDVGPSTGFGGFPSRSPPNLQTSSQGYSGEKYLPAVATTAVPIVRKQFYVVSAAEDEDSQQRNKHLILGRPQKTYRVVFIKAPGSGSGNIKYSAEYASQEEKTVIYVLSKKDNELDASDIATPAPTVASKPQVFFIKYKTDQEAQQAQKEIQGEYDKLGGTNEVSDETTAPITSVIGALDSLNPDGSYNYRQPNSVDEKQRQHSADQAPSAQYLPSSLFRH